MPGGSGVALLGSIRSRPDLRDLPVVVVTGSPREEVDWLVARERRTAPLRKPFSSGELVVALKALIEASRP